MTRDEDIAKENGGCTTYREGGSLSAVADLDVDLKAVETEMSIDDEKDRTHRDGGTRFSLVYNRSG